MLTHSRWGQPSPLHTIRINGVPFDVQPNLHKALRSLRRPLTGNFWIDAICINQQDNVERTQQVRAMSETYGNATMVAAWIGPCDDIIRPLFVTPIPTDSNPSGRGTRDPTMMKACNALSERRYWTRIWIQQEMLLQPNVTMFCGEYQQPLFPLLQWLQFSEYKDMTQRDFIYRMCRFRDMVRRPTLLEIVTYFSACESKDTRDKIFALISLVEGPERDALMQHLPDYSLTLSKVVQAVLRHIRKFSGQRRCAMQLGSILCALGEPGDTKLHSATFGEHIGLCQLRKAGLSTTKAVTYQQKHMMQRSFVLDGRVSWYDVFQCIFAPPGGQRPGEQEVWVLDPALPRDREDHLIYSMAM